MSSKDHVVWIVGAGLLALAGEGFQHTAGEPLAHTLGVAPSLIFVGGATGLGWLWSAFFEGAKKPEHEAPKPRAKSPAKAKRKPRR